MKVLLEGTAEVRDLCLQVDPSIISYRHIMTRAMKDANFGLITSLLRAGASLRREEIDASNALFEASRRGNQDLVNMLLDFGANVNSRLFQDELGWTPLSDAIMSEISVNNGNREPHTDNANWYPAFDMIRLLLDRGADPDAKQAGGKTVLHMALGLGETYVQLLLSAGADVNARDDQQQSVLDLALDDSIRMVELLVENGVNLEARDSKGRTALLKAVRKQHCAARVETLIRHGADIHAKDTGGCTVLHHLHSSNISILQRFLELGVDVNTRDASGARPLDIAVRDRNNERIELLLDSEAITGEREAGRTILHDLYRPTDSIVQRLLERGGDLNARNDSGATPLDLAVRESDNVKYELLYMLGGIHGARSTPPLTEAADRCNPELVHFLLGVGSDPNLLGFSQKSAISSAVKVRHKGIVSALLEAGANPNPKDESAMSPLARAILNKDRYIAKLLMDAGAVVQPPTSIPYSPLVIAIKSGDVSMVELLIQHGAEVSSSRFSDLSLLDRHTEMCDFLTRHDVPFRVFREDVDL